uniref:Sodium/solute symporter n=2 Tax=Chromera velia CCMP2878 TaxID=1169474 RepID=A0A0G4HST1_9ALVE|eukprot:Cvel_31085.t1-p1 / transcript=Cvel_31085.t1 / gene=Cvel_31085 / organism=Chromera_velia_CCMP2878 / gene_product=Sodium/glucose cotransporter 5, putative / transcript_product=Sodium/glucose cotransporter 5, putative / location=Cvel_scaffold4560:3301-6348(-) / protein_length=794 / sequence_SO=supercontig / SO=protein_coding / is_pseudo=false
MNFGVADYVVVGVVVLLFALIVWVSSRNRARAQSVDSYFLSCRSMTWWSIGLSLFASNIGTEHLVGQAGAAASTGLGVMCFEILGGLYLVLLGFLFYPVYRAAGVSTVPEYFEKRFNPACRYIMVALSLAVWVIVRIAAPLYGATLVFRLVLEWDVWVSAALVIGVTLAYGLFGGLAAVMYTDVLQSAIFTTAGIAGCIVIFSHFGGLRNVQTTLDRAGLPHFFDSLRSHDDELYPWPGVLLNVFSGVWYFCTDQVMVQRALASRSLFDAKVGALVGALLKTVVVVAIHFPGVVARAAYEACRESGGKVYPDWCTPSLSDPSKANLAYLLLVVRHFPQGLSGLMVCGWVAAVMSSLDSVLNSSAALFTLDVWRRGVHPRAKNRELVVVGRIATVLVGCLAFAWLPMILRGGASFYLFTAEAAFHIAPAASAVLILGVLVPSTKWVNGAGAVVGLCGGVLFGLGRYVAVVATGAKKMCETLQGNGIVVRGDWFLCMSFQNFGCLAGGVALLLTITVSFLVSVWGPSQWLGAPGGLGGLTVWTSPESWGGLGRKRGGLNEKGQIEAVVKEEEEEERGSGKGIEEPGPPVRAETAGECSSGAAEKQYVEDAEEARRDEKLPQSDSVSSPPQPSNVSLDRDGEVTHGNESSSLDGAGEQEKEGESGPSGSLGLAALRSVSPPPACLLGPPVGGRVGVAGETLSRVEVEDSRQSADDENSLQSSFARLGVASEAAVDLGSEKEIENEVKRREEEKRLEWRDRKWYVALNWAAGLVIASRYLFIFSFNTWAFFPSSTQTV